jgi:hypothetical protein
MRGLILLVIHVVMVFSINLNAEEKMKKPKIEDTLVAHIYADNWFKLYINGELIAVDSISFIPHNVISVQILPTYPMTLAVMAKDHADPKTGLEYNDTQIGDGGFVLKFSDGTVSDESWKVKVLSHGPLDSNLEKPRVIHHKVPDNWHTVEFDDSAWDLVHTFKEERVKPKKPFYQVDFSGAQFIWSEDLNLDNTVLRS